jgi:paraquat-inducible protein B
VKTKVSPTLVGLFVLGAMLLGIITLFSFGNVNFFSKPERFIVYFDETIHGLDNGSPVKLRGVRIGRVVNMNVRAIPPSPGSPDARSVVAVVCELSRNVVADGQGNPVDVSDRAQLEHLVDQGLRAQLGVVGLATGLLYVELDFYDPKLHPAKTRPGIASDYLEMPAVTSAIAEFQANLTDTLNEIRKINFAKLAQEIEGLLVDTRRQINAADLAAVSREWAQAGKAVRDLADSPETRALLVSASSAAARFDRVMGELEKSAGPASTEFTALLKEARGAMTEFTETTTVMKRFVNAQQYLGDDASKAFVRLSDAAAAIARLADFLERNPNALLSGRATDATRTPENK